MTAEDEVVEEAEEIADAAAEADAIIEAEEAEAKPRQEGPAASATAKKAAADEVGARWVDEGADAAASVPFVVEEEP